MTQSTTGPGRPTVRRRRVLITGLKGGVGKTTVTVQLGASLARRGLRVLLVDLDPQAHATFYITGIHAFQLEHHVGTVLRDFSTTPKSQRASHARTLVAQSVLDVQDPAVSMPSEQHREAWGDMHILPGHTDCAWLQFTPDHLRDLQHTIDSVEQDYDVILIDSAPSAWALTLVGVYAAQSVIAVTTPKAMSLHGLNQIFGLIGEVRTNHPQLEFAGVIANLVRRRYIEHDHHLTSLEEQLGDLLTEPHVGGHTDIEKSEGAHLPLHAMPGGMARYLADSFDTLATTLIAEE